MRERLDRRALGLLILSAISFTFGVLWLRARQDLASPSLALGVPATDTYAYFYPHIVHAWRSIREGGGLLWNPYQACGQPFFGLSVVGVLYPPNLLFAVLDREPAVLAHVVVSLVIAGVGAFLLCRELGAGVPAAFCGAIAYQLGPTTVQLAAWSPVHIAPYAWIPVAMYGTERLVRDPGARRAVALAIVLAIQLLPGFYQTVFFTYQLVALRIAWALITRETRRPLALMAAGGAALGLPVLLTAVQLAPSLGAALQSVRSRPLEPGDIGPAFSWARLGSEASGYATSPGSILLVMVAAAAVGARRPRAPAFYLLVAAVYFVLSVGPGTPLYAAYERLPLGGAFRSANRLLWVTSFALAVLVGLGTAAILEPGSRSRWSRRWTVAPLVTAGLLVLVLTGGGRRIDWLFAVLLVGVALVTRWPRFARLAAVALPALVWANSLLFGPPPLFKLQSGDIYGGAAPAFALVRERLTAQDRVLIAGRHLLPYELTPKTATLFRVPSIADYETQTSLRYVDFFTFMRTGHPMRHFQEWFWMFGDMTPPTIQRPLFDLTAARYLLVDPAVDHTTEVLRSGVRLLADLGSVRVYENEQALPRARYVASIAVTPDADVLGRLAGPTLDPLRVALVDRAPSSGFLGADPNARGRVMVMGNDPERVMVQVEAPAPGFLFLADQYYPGWTARVNGRPVEILRADYTFRAVEVPAGRSEVVFAYRPASVAVGAAISLLTIIGLVLAGLRAGRSARASCEGV